MGPYRIRRARLRDRHDVRALVDAAYAPYLQWFPIGHQLRGIDFWAMIVFRQLWVLEDRQHVVGTIMFRDNSTHLLLFLVTVLPSAQRRGYGRALIEFAEAEARRRSLIGLRLHTPQAFENAIGFYRHLGFAELAQQELYGYPFIFMMKRLNPTAPRP